MLVVAIAAEAANAILVPVQADQDCFNACSVAEELHARPVVTLAAPAVAIPAATAAVDAS